MVFDGHGDIFTGVLQRWLQGHKNILAQEFLPLLRRGNIEGGCFVIWVDPPYTVDYAARTQQMMVAITDDLADCTEARIIRNLSEIEAAKAADQFYILMGAEGLASIGRSLENLDRLYAFGVRHAMLTWNEENALATGALGRADRGVTDFGKKVLHHMENKHMLIDVSHLNDRSFWDVMDTVTGPVLASHSNARALANVPRNLTDEQLRVIAEHDGIVGLNAFNAFVSCVPAEQNVDRFIDHAVYIADLIGVDHLAFGFDFCDYVSQETQKSFSDQDAVTLPGLENYTKVPNLLVRMRKAGFSTEDLEKIASGNWLRMIGSVLGD